MGIILFFVSCILLIILFLPIFIYGTISNIFNDNSYYLNMAEAIDRFGNVLCAPLFNNILINKLGYKFGKGKETISSVLGKNIQVNCLTKLGLFLSNVLNKLQKDHCINSIDNNI